MGSHLPSPYIIREAKVNVRPSFIYSPVTWMYVPSPALLQSMKSEVKGINYSISMKPMNGSSTTSPTTSGRKRILPKICQMSLPAYPGKFSPGFLKSIRPGSQNSRSVKKTPLRHSRDSSEVNCRLPIKVIIILKFIFLEVAIYILHFQVMMWSNFVPDRLFVHIIYHEISNKYFKLGRMVKT